MVKKTSFEKYILKEAKIIKDPEVFKMAYPPKELIERKESTELFREVASFINYRKSNHILIKGPPGVGKTVTVRAVLSEIESLNSGFELFEINCAAKASNDILSSLNDQSTQKETFEDGLKSFLSKLDKDALIVFDEIDRSYKIDSLLYYLSRPSEIIKNFKHNINLILISNNLGWDENIRDSTRSSLQLKNITFSPYSADKLKQIVKKRIEIGFIDPKAISEQSIDIICQDTAHKRKGDCRVAIETTFYAAQNAESKGRTKIIHKDITNALKIVINSLDKERISKLKDNQLIVLFCCLLENKRSLDNFYRDYSRCAKSHNFKIQSKGMVFHIIQYLSDMGFIDKSHTIEKEANLPPKRIMEIKCKISYDPILNELRLRDLRLSKEEK